MIDIVDIGHRTIKVPDKPIQFETLDEYYTIAEKLVATHASNYRAGLAREILANEDAIANIAHAIMMADWQFDGRGKLHGFRKLTALFAIRNYLERSRRKGHNCKVLSLDAKSSTSDDTDPFSHVISSDVETPAEILDQDELKTKIAQLLDSGVISEKQATYIREHYFDGASMADIATAHQTSRQNVHDSIQRALRKLRLYMEQDTYFSEGN